MDEFTRSVGPNPLVVIEDMEMLDADSATLTQLLISGGHAQVIGTARHGAALPCAIRQLIHRGDLDHIEIQRLGVPDMIELAQSILCGPIDAVTRRRMIEMTDGNPLFLRELLIAGMTSGALSEHDGLWSWDGEMTAGGRLAVMFSDWNGVDPAIMEVLQLVSLANDIDLALLEQLLHQSAIEGAEQSGLAATVEDGHRCRVHLAHSIYTGPVLATITTTLKRRLTGRLCDALRTNPGRRADDELRWVALNLTSGRRNDPAELDRAATKARELGQIDLAEQLGRTGGCRGRWNRGHQPLGGDPHLVVEVR